MLNETESPIYCQKYLDKISEISLDNKYTRWYLNLCRKAALRSNSKKQARQILGYTESHHVVLRAFNLHESKDKDNLVHLSGREHFVAHLILTKMFGSGYRYLVVVLAFECMSMKNRANGGEQLRGAKYQELREEASRASSEILRGKSRPVTKKQRAMYDSRKGNPSEAQKVEYASRKSRIKTPAQIAWYNGPHEALHSVESRTRATNSLLLRYQSGNTLQEKISAAVKSHHRLNPDWVNSHVAQIRNLPSIICEVCSQTFKYQKNFDEHKCHKKDPIKSELTYKAYRDHPDIQAKRAKTLASHKLMTCHCGRTFSSVGKWRKHKGCTGNPKLPTPCELCKKTPESIYASGRFCSSTCYRTFSSRSRFSGPTSKDGTKS
jgi:hypothetical protein